MASPAGETTRPMQGNRTRNITLAELATQCTEEEPTNEAETVSSVAISSPESINRESCQSIGNPERGVDGTEGARLPMVTESPATSGSGRSVHIIQEIIDTEKTYVQDLWDVINGYETPCIDTQIFDDDEDFISLFGNMDELYDFNSSLLCQLEQADGDPVKIGSCFIENEQKFHQYTLYCTNYPRSVAVLTSYTQLKNKVADFLKTCQKALGHALPLGSYLLKPVQRILKYRLLLMDLVKHTDLSTEGNAILEKALSTMTSVAEHINEMKKLHEATVRVQEIQSLLTDWKGEDLTKYGRLVLEDSFRVVGARDPRQVFLFEKLVLVTKHRDDGKYSYKNHFETGDMTLTESIGREPTSLSFQICPYQNVRDSITIQTGTLEIKQKWIATIRRLIIDSWPNLPPKARKIVLGLQEGKDAVPPPLSFSPSELPVLTAPIGITARKRLNTSRSLRRPRGRGHQKRPRSSMPASLLEPTLPGDIKESQFGNNPEEDANHSPIAFNSPLFANTDRQDDVEREKSSDTTERSTADEGNSLQQWRLRERTYRVGKEALQKLRQSRQYRERHQIVAEDAVSPQENESINGPNDAQWQEQIDVTSQRPRSPFVRKPVMKHKENQSSVYTGSSPVFRRRSEALRASRPKKTKSMILPVLTSQDTNESPRTRRSSFAGKRAPPENAMDKDNDSDSEWDFTIVDTTFQKYTISGDDQWHSVAEEDRADEKPSHDFQQKQTEPSNDASLDVQLSSGNALTASCENATRNQLSPEDNGETTTTYHLEDHVMWENGIEVWTHEEGSPEVASANSSKPGSPRYYDYYLTIVNPTSTGDGTTRDKSTVENAVASGKLEVDFDGPSAKSESEEAVGHKTTEFLLVEENKDKLDETSRVSSARDDLSLRESPQAAPPHIVSYDSSTVMNSNGELEHLKKEDGDDLGEAEFTTPVVAAEQPLRLGPCIGEGVEKTVVDDRAVALTMERGLETKLEGDQNVYWEKEVIASVSEVTNVVEANHLENVEEEERRRDDDVQIDQECSLERIAPQPENIFDLGDVGDAIAALSILSPPSLKEPPLPLPRAKQKTKDDHQPAMMSLEEALEMDMLPCSPGLSEQRSTSTEFPLWLQRTKPMRTRRKSRSLENLQILHFKEGKGDGTRCKSEPPTASGTGEKKTSGSVWMRARNYSRMLKEKGTKGRDSKQPDRRSVSIHNSPGIGRRLAELGIRHEERRKSECTSARLVNETLDPRRLRVPEDTPGDTVSIDSGTSDVLGDTQNEKDAMPQKGWVKKLVAKFQTK